MTLRINVKHWPVRVYCGLTDSQALAKGYSHNRQCDTVKWNSFEDIVRYFRKELTTCLHEKKLLNEDGSFSQIPYKVLHLPASNHLLHYCHRKHLATKWESCWTCLKSLVKWPNRPCLGLSGSFGGGFFSFSFYLRLSFIISYFVYTRWEACILGWSYLFITNSLW